MSWSCWKKRSGLSINKGGGYERKQNRTVARCKKIQCTDGNWDYDEYMRGMANGIILALAIMEGKEPEYKDAEKAAESRKRRERQKKNKKSLPVAIRCGAGRTAD